MSRVAYVIPQQGFRPRTNPMGALNLRGLRGLGSSPDASGMFTTSPLLDLVAPGFSGVYALYHGVTLIFSPGEPTPTLNVDNAITGTLTPDQVSQIKATAAQDITVAAAGDAALASQQIALANAQIDAVLGPSIPMWAWAAGAAAAAFLLAKVL